MSARRREEFPARWDPPPRIGYGEHVPDLLGVIEATIDEDAAPWVRQLFVHKVVFQSTERSRFVLLNPRTMNDDDLRRTITVLGRIPEGPLIANQRLRAIENELEYDKDVSPARQALLEDFRRLADRAKPESDE